jgi:hypothetical protein
VILLTALYSALFLAQVDEPYVWPLEQPRALTSSFAEYRSDRFHMGIDLRTGPIGKEVFAADDGYVTRIRCSPYGYGKAVYVQLNDGNTAIYAHLNDFIPEFTTYLRAAQHQRTSYTVDLYPEAHAFPVKRGQLIGFSGQTGIGVPHLHWEIRDRSGTPINPRTLGLEWPDTPAPRFRNVLLIPTTPDSTINGDYLPVVLPVTRTESGDYHAAKARVRGSVALGVDVYDPANKGASKLGVYRITTTADDESIFNMTHERVSYAHSGDGVVAYHPLYRNKGHFLMQWPWPGIKTEMYSTSSGSGVITVGETARSVRVEAVDFFDHDSTLTLELESDSSTEKNIPAPDTVDSGTGSVFYNAVGDWLVVSVQFSTPESIVPLLLESGVPSTTVPFTRVNAHTFRARYTPSHDGNTTGISIDHPRAGRDAQSQLPLEHTFLMPYQGGINTTLGAVSLSIEAQDVYSPLFITGGLAPAESKGELHALGSAYVLWPEQAPFRSVIEVTFPLPEDAPANVAVFRKKGKDWKWVESKKRDGVLVIETQKLGTYQLMQDTQGPTIAFKHPAQSGIVSSNTPRIQIRIEDTGSTIKRWAAHFNHEWLLMAYDPEEDELVWEGDKALPSGNGELVVRVEDEAGNVSTKQLTLTIP